MEDIYLIQILKDHLNERPTELPSSLNYDGLIDYAKKQNLEGIVYSQIKIPSLQKSYAASLYNYVNREKVLLTIEEAMRRENIKYFIVKGFAIAQLYPQPQLRTMGDCDVVVHSVDKEKMHDIMISLGARCEGKASHEWKYSIQNMEFEIHDHLIYQDERNPRKVVEFFDTSWDYVEHSLLDWNFHFIFLLYHLRKHIMGEGAGIRQFMDLAFVIRSVDLNWEKIKENVKYLEIGEFFNRVLMLLKAWFDIVVLDWSVEIDTAFVNSATEKILKDGIFGFGDFDNRGNYALIKAYKKGKIAMLKWVWNAVFLPYKDMIWMPEYVFLIGRPYLLPVAWIYRIALKWKKRREIISAYMISNKKVNARMTYLKQWGLESVLDSKN